MTILNMDGPTTIFCGWAFMNLRRYEFLLYVGPGLAYFLSLGIFPLLFSIYISFHLYQLNRPELGNPFVGVANYINAIRDPLFHDALFRSFLLTTESVILQMLLGLGLALLLATEFRGCGLTRSLLLMPMTLTPVVVGLLWRYQFQPGAGILEWIASMITGKSFYVLGEPQLALHAIVLTEVWHWTPFVMLILLSGLLAMPVEPFEAAKIDGASAIQTFRYITFPLLKRSFLVALLFRTTDSLLIFDKILLLTEGGPGTATQTLTYYNFLTAFSYWRVGYAAAISILTVIILNILSNLFIRLIWRK